MKYVNGKAIYKTKRQNRAIRLTAKGLSILIMEHRKRCRKCSGLLIGCVKGMTLKHDFDLALIQERAKKCDTEKKV